MLMPSLVLNILIANHVAVDLVPGGTSSALPAVAVDCDMPTRKAAWSMSYGDHRERCLYELTQDVSSAAFCIASVRKICNFLL